MRSSTRAIVSPNLLLFATAMFASSANAQHPRLFPVRQYVPSSTPSDFATGDFNSDGYPDLVHTRASYSFLFLQLGGPEADFRPAPTQPDGEYELDYLGAADMNGDGELDLVLGPAGSGTVGVMLGDGAGILADPIRSGRVAAHLPGIWSSPTWIEMGCRMSLRARQRSRTASTSIAGSATETSPTWAP